MFNPLWARGARGKMQDCGNTRLRNARMKFDNTTPFSSRRRAGDEVPPAMKEGEGLGMRPRKKMQECGNARMLKARMITDKSPPSPCLGPPMTLSG